MKKWCMRCKSELTKTVVRTCAQKNVTTRVIRLDCPCCGLSEQDYDVAFVPSRRKAVHR